MEVLYHITVAEKGSRQGAENGSRHVQGNLAYITELLP